MPANRYGIDIGDVYRTAEAVKGQRVNNALAQEKLDTIKSSKRKNVMLQPIRQKAAQGDKSAAKRLIAIDPENGPAYIQALNELDLKELEMNERRINELGNAAAHIKRQKTREEAEKLYHRYRADASPSVRSFMPATYTPDFIDYMLGKATAMSDYTAEVKTVRFGGEDVMLRGNKEVGRAKRPETNKSGGIKTSDVNGIRASIGDALGAKFTKDERTGQIRYVGLGDDQNRKAVAATTRAVELFREYGPGSQAKAVQQALEELGMSFPKPGSKQGGQRFRLNKKTGKSEQLIDGKWQSIS